jgi:hypothetical protein
MSYSNEELEIQGNVIKKNVLIVFAPIAIMILIIFFIQNNSVEHTRKLYLELKNDEYNGIIVSKREEGDYYRAGRFILMNNGREERISNEIYYEVNVGDSVYKKKGQDSTYYILKKGKILINDDAIFYREKYHKLLNKKNENSTSN